MYMAFPDNVFISPENEAKIYEMMKSAEVDIGFKLPKTDAIEDALRYMGEDKALGYYLAIRDE